MMKRTRDEVQFGTRPGPGGVGGSGGGGTGPGGGVVSGSTNLVGAPGSVVSGGVNIGTVVPGGHGPTGLSVGISGNLTASSLAHHRILTPQHGGAQTIAYLPSTTPQAATNLKTSIGQDSGNSSTGSTISSVVSSSAGNNVGVTAQTVQYSTCEYINI